MSLIWISKCLVLEFLKFEIERKSSVFDGIFEKVGEGALWKKLYSS